MRDDEPRSRSEASQRGGLLSELIAQILINAVAGLWAFYLIWTRGPDLIGPTAARSAALVLIALLLVRPLSARLLAPVLTVVLFILRSL
jgi:hypothetical protein